VRVRAELIDTADGSTIWSERYDRPYRDLFGLQDEITQAVAGALRTRLVPTAQFAQSDRPPSGSLEAYNAFLKGRYFFFHDGEANYRQAIEDYTESTRLDPRYHQAWSGLARAWSRLAVEYLTGAAEQEAVAKARAAAETARALAPDAVATHLAWGHLYQYVDFDQQRAEASYRRAVELAPQDSDAKYTLADEPATLGQVEQAVNIMREALSLDPLRAAGYNRLATYLIGLNRLDEAEQAARRAVSLQPAAASFHLTMVMIAIQRRNAHAALEAAQQEVPGVWRDIALALARQIGGDPSQADAALQALIDRDADLAAYQIAQTYALRADADKTFEWLDHAWAVRDSGITYLLYDPLILRYQGDPRLAAFCRKVGLPVPGEAAAVKPI
jgi:serine/threonine-protein kinase